MPPVKKPPKNAFSFYMDEFIPELRKKGIKISHKEEAVPHLLQEWKSLPKSSKEPYEEMAREWKILHHGRNARPDNEKLDCFGIPVVNHDSYEQLQKNNAPVVNSYLLDYATAFLNGEIELALISYQSMFEDPDELGYMPVEISLARYDLGKGLFDEYNRILDPGPPDYGMKAECRQWAVQTHHIDPYNDLNEKLLEQHMSTDSMETVWINLVDKVHESQNKTEEDAEYLRHGDNFIIPTFTTRREHMKNESCNLWLKEEFMNSATIINNAHNEKYFQTELGQPLVVEDLIKTIYEVHNSQTPNPIDIPTDTELQRDIDRPLYCINSPVRCDFHETIDCDYCTRMEVHRAVYTISKHLKRMGYTLEGNHFPEEEEEYSTSTIATTFVYEKTEHQKNFERRQRYKENSGYGGGNDWYRSNSRINTWVDQTQNNHYGAPAQDFRATRQPLEENRNFDRTSDSGRKQLGNNDRSSEFGRKSFECAERNSNFGRNEFKTVDRSSDFGKRELGNVDKSSERTSFDLSSMKSELVGCDSVSQSVQHKPRGVTDKPAAPVVAGVLGTKKKKKVMRGRGKPRE